MFENQNSDISNETKREKGSMIRSRIDDLLWQKRLRVAELIKRSGLAPETIYRARKDETLPSCSIRTLEIIARALDVKVKDLFEED